MLFTVMALFLVTVEGCELPAQLTGQWDSSTSLRDLTITNTTVRSLEANKKNLDFTCFMHNGTTFVLQSPAQSVAGMTYHYYTCWDVVPSDSSNDIVFFRILTEANPEHYNDTVVSIFDSNNKTIEDICQKNRTQMPMDYNIFLRKGYEQNLGNDTCPSSLQATFAANFTEPLDYSKCPEGFELDGCDRSHLTFNYTQCGSSENSTESESSGSLNYTCLTYVEQENVTFTIIYLTNDGGPQGTSNFDFACLEQRVAEDGQLVIKKSAGVCGAMPSVHITANETLSCRVVTTPSPTTTEQGSNTTSQMTPSSHPPTTSTGGQGGGGGGDGEDGSSSATMVTATGLVVLLMSALISALPAIL